jgi:hypothetical protein
MVFQLRLVQSAALTSLGVIHELQCSKWSAVPAFLSGNRQLR